MKMETKRRVANWLQKWAPGVVDILVDNRENVMIGKTVETMIQSLPVIKDGFVSPRGYIPLPARIGDMSPGVWAKAQAEEWYASLTEPRTAEVRYDNGSITITFHKAPTKPTEEPKP